MTARVVVTGASGFVGHALCAHLRARGFEVVRVTRSPGPGSDFAVGDLRGDSDWSAVLKGADAVVHAAARVHHLDDDAGWSAYHETNVLGTRRLAECAARADVRRFVFISTVKVHGEMTQPGAPFRASDPLAPTDFYASSKRDAEAALCEVAAGSPLEAVIVRPPLVYGAGVRANFAQLVDWVRKRRPLPFGAVDNRRSLVARQNLCDFVATCLVAPAAVGRAFLVSDGEDLSTPELIRRIARAAGVEPRIVSVPLPLLRLAGRAVRRGDAVARLTSSLQVDITDAATTLGWRPPISVDAALRDLFE